MNESAYIKSRNTLFNTYKEQIVVKADEGMNGQFNMVSAALVNYLPDIPVDEHEEIFKNILLHKKLSILEQSTYEALDHSTPINLTSEIANQLKAKPTIICTFHTGSYRLLNLYLTKNNIPYSLVIGKDIVAQEGELFRSMYQGLPGQHANENFHIIDAEQANVGLQMLRQLKKGHSLLLYMDGNTGAGAATTKNDNRCAIDFLGQQLFARKGIAFLAHTANVPIVTIATYRTSRENIAMRFFDPIYPDKNRERARFAEEVTQQIYDMVAPIIRQYPEQWESWLYLHKVAKIKQPVRGRVSRNVATASEKICLDSFQFGIFKANGIPFLLKKTTYSFYQINDQLYELLTKCDKGPVEKDFMHETLFNQLYEQGVIHYL